MNIGAKITLGTGIGAARDGLAGLAGACWLIRQPRQPDCRRGHPAGSARPVRHAFSGGSGLVAVVFGILPASAGAPPLLPFRWEPLEQKDKCDVLLDGDITLTPLPGDEGSSTITLAGVCQALPDVCANDGHEQATLQLMETARAFIADVATVLADSPGPGQRPRWDFS